MTTGLDLERLQIEKEKVKALMQIANVLSEYLPKIDEKLDGIEVRLNYMTDNWKRLEET